MTVIMGSELSAMAAGNLAAMGLPMAPIPGGTFMMGSTDGNSDERPVHQVTVDSFQMGVTPVTNGEYARYMDRLGRKRFVKIGIDPRTGLERVFALGDDEGKIDRLAGEELLDVVIPNMAVVNGLRVFADVNQAVLASFRTARIEDHRLPRGFDGPRQPVINVNWDEALAFANLIGVRFPTEAEWEFAARVRPDGGLRTYATLNDDVEESHYWRDGKTTSTIDVDDSRYPSLPSGLRHMSGNVWEWALDWFGPYSEGSANNPAGPLSGQLKILRGGSWYGDPQGRRAASRGFDCPDNRGDDVGFRCASSPRTPELT